MLQLEWIATWFLISRRLRTWYQNCATGIPSEICDVLLSATARQGNTKPMLSFWPGLVHSKSPSICSLTEYIEHPIKALASINDHQPDRIASFFSCSKGARMHAAPFKKSFCQKASRTAALAGAAAHCCWGDGRLLGETIPMAGLLHDLNVCLYLPIGAGWRPRGVNYCHSFSRLCGDNH